MNNGKDGVEYFTFVISFHLHSSVRGWEGLESMIQTKCIADCVGLRWNNLGSFVQERYWKPMVPKLMGN